MKCKGSAYIKMADNFDRSNISPTLFTQKDGSCIIFFMRPCNERQHLRPIIQDGGGKITSKLIQGSIKLAEKGSMVSTEGYITTQFITDCVEQKKLLDPDSYKVTVGTRVRSHSGNSDVSIRSFDSSDSMSPAPNAVHSTRDIKGRTKYTKEDDLAILNYLIDQRRYSEATGMRVFKDMEMMKVTAHTASSMNTRYRKCIIPNIDNYKYDIEPRWLARLTGGVPVKDKEPEFSVEALFTVNRKRPVVRNAPAKKFFKADQSSSSEQANKNNQKLTNSIIDLTGSKYCTVTLEKLNVNKEVEKADSVIATSSQASWHTADETVSMKSPKLDRKPVCQESVYDFTSQSEKDAGSTAKDSIEDTNTICRKENVSVDSDGCRSPRDIFEMDDGTMTQHAEFSKDSDLEDLELDSSFMDKCKEKVYEVIHTAVQHYAEMKGNSQPEKHQTSSNKTQAVLNTNSNNINQQNSDTETQPPFSDQIYCNTVSSSSDLALGNSPGEDSFDQMLIDYVQPDINKIDCVQPVTDKIDCVQPVTDKIDCVQPVTDKIDCVQPVTDKIDCVQPVADKIDCVQPVADKIDCVQPVTDKAEIRSGKSDLISEHDSFDGILHGYVGESEDNVKGKCDVKKKKQDTEGISDPDSFDGILHKYVDENEDNVKGKCGVTKRKQDDRTMKNVKHITSKSTNKEDQADNDTVSVEERREIERCTSLCKKLAGEYGLNVDFVIKLLIQCSGDARRLEAYILYGPYSPMLPPWSEVDDAVLMSDPHAVQLVRKYSEEDVLYRYKYLAD